MLSLALQFYFQSNNGEFCVQVLNLWTYYNGEEDVWFVVQTVADRRFRRRKNLPSVSLLWRRFQHDVHFNNRWHTQRAVQNCKNVADLEVFLPFCDDCIFCQPGVLSLRKVSFGWIKHTSTGVLSCVFIVTFNIEIKCWYVIECSCLIVKFLRGILPQDKIIVLREKCFVIYLLFWWITGIDFKIKTVELGGKKIKLQIW